MCEDVRWTRLARCAGCGAKVGAGALARLLEGLEVRRDPALLVGFDASDDAAVYRVTDQLALVQTIDFFPPVVDDARTYGQIAAANALSDIYAMGGEPRVALNVMAVPEDMPPEEVRALLRGGHEKVTEAGAVICGGHSIHAREPLYGLAVTGFVDPERMWTNGGARPGDALLLTKPLGVGILLTAQKAGLLSAEGLKTAVRLMCTLNKAARDAAARYRVHACTDVTGFSLLGHCVEMASASGATIALELDAIDLLAEAVDCAEMGLVPEGAYRNRDFAAARVERHGVPLAKEDVLFDPQTSGGLLLAVDPRDADALMGDLRACVPSAQQVGMVREKQAKDVIVNG